MPPALLWCFACLAVEAGEEPVVTFDESDACVSFLTTVLRGLEPASGQGMAPQQFGCFAIGALVQGLYPNGEWYDAVVGEVNGGGDGGYTLDWVDGDQGHRRQPGGGVRARGAARDSALLARGCSPAVARAVLSDAINATQAMVDDSAPLSEPHRQVYTSSRVFTAKECKRAIGQAEANGW